MGQAAAQHGLNLPLKSGDSKEEGGTDAHVIQFVADNVDHNIVTIDGKYHSM